MKLAFQLAYRNLMGAGLRTWLNVAILSFAYVVVIFYNGLLDGWNRQARTDSIAWDFGQGQLRNADFDPYDPFTLQDGHANLQDYQQQGLEPVFINQATIYPEGRMVSILLKGIEPNQKSLALPTPLLQTANGITPALIGKNMARVNQLEKGDDILLRWRDKNGTFDAGTITIVGIFDTTVPSVDAGQIWIPLDRMWEMTGWQGHATYFQIPEGYDASPEGWTLITQKELLSDIDEIISMKKTSGSIMYLLLLAIALLAIFDTQVLSIFRRQKEIGTYISLGMTRLEVVGIFTVEGSVYSILATILGSLYGIPLFVYLAQTGIAMPAYSQDVGMAIAERLFPVFGFKLIVGTVALIIISSTIVSFIPARKIARMDPVAALKGKLQ